MEMELLVMLIMILFVATEYVQGRAIHLNKKSSPVSCSEPDDTSLYNDWVEHLKDENGQTDNFYLLPALRSTIFTQLNESDNLNVNKYQISGNSICPDDLSEIPTTASVEERSTCPWYFVLNYDPQRFPRTLYESKCSCQNCVGLDSSEARCEPFYYNTRVLRRTGECSQGVYTYKTGWQKLAVGCTCSLRPSGSGPLLESTS